MLHNYLKGKKIVLASASPRRVEIFKMLGIKALQKVANVEEEHKFKNPGKIVCNNARIKAESVAANMPSDCVVVGGDTIVYHNSKVLGKPRDEAEAKSHLLALSDDTHIVYSGLAIKYKNQVYTGFEKTKVTFKKLAESEIDEYIKTKEPLDKAGAYGIQGYGSQFVQKINGCYFNVMGFPVALFYNILAQQIFNK